MRPMWNLVEAQEFACGAVKDWVVLKCKGESTSIDLGEIHELGESRTRIGAKDIDFIAGTLIKPGLLAWWRDRTGCVTWCYLKKTGRRTLI